jgi:hypothetical protein
LFLRVLAYRSLEASPLAVSRFGCFLLTNALARIFGSSEVVVRDNDGDEWASVVECRTVGAVDFGGCYRGGCDGSSSANGYVVSCPSGNAKLTPVAASSSSTVPQFY